MLIRGELPGQTRAKKSTATGYPNVQAIVLNEEVNRKKRSRKGAKGRKGRKAVPRFQRDFFALFAPLRLCVKFLIEHITFQ